MNQRQKTLQFAFIILLLVGLVLMFQPVRSFFDKNLVSSNLLISSRTSQKTWFYNLFHLVAFTNDYNNLQIQNKDLINNYLTSNLTNLSPLNNKINGLEARVLKSDDASSGNYFWIDKGSLNGVAVGMNVVGDDDAAIGLIANVYHSSSLVKNILSPKTKISVMDLRSKSLGVAVVNPQGKFYLDYLQLKSDVKINDILVATSDNKEYLAGLVIGKVIQEDGGNRTYYLEPIIDLRQTFGVKVLTQPSKN
jgi:cell shape-determining protein MreC